MVKRGGRDQEHMMRLYRERLFAEGKDEGEVNTLVDLLKLKLGKLSPKAEIEIERSTDEQLNQLKINIFNIEKEKDIEKILSNDNEHDISNIFYLLLNLFGKSVSSTYVFRLSILVS